MKILGVFSLDTPAPIAVAQTAPIPVTMDNAAPAAPKADDSGVS
jgi:hypothetical protein